MGGDNMTKALSEKLQIPEASAERIKIEDATLEEDGKDGKISIRVGSRKRTIFLTELKKVLLSEYTNIPTTSVQLGNMLEFSSLGNRSQIFWGLGNKMDIKAVEILESFMRQSAGEEHREILKSLKKIEVRPGITPPIKVKIEKIFSAQRRKGIII